MPPVMYYNKIKKIQTFFIELCNAMIVSKDASSSFCHIEILLCLERILLTSKLPLNMELEGHCHSDSKDKGLNIAVSCKIVFPANEY